MINMPSPSGAASDFALGYSNQQNAQAELRLRALQAKQQDDQARAALAQRATEGAEQAKYDTGSLAQQKYAIDTNVKERYYAVNTQAATAAANIVEKHWETIQRWHGQLLIALWQHKDRMAAVQASYDRAAKAYQSAQARTSALIGKGDRDFSQKIFEIAAAASVSLSKEESTLGAEMGRAGLNDYNADLRSNMTPAEAQAASGYTPGQGNNVTIQQPDPTNLFNALMEQWKHRNDPAPTTTTPDPNAQLPPGPSPTDGVFGRSSPGFGLNFAPSHNYSAQPKPAAVTPSNIGTTISSQDKQGAEPIIDWLTKNFRKDERVKQFHGLSYYATIPPEVKRYIETVLQMKP